MCILLVKGLNHNEVGKGTGNDGDKPRGISRDIKKSTVRKGRGG